MFSNPGPQTKIGRAMGILLSPVKILTLRYGAYREFALAKDFF